MTVLHTGFIYEILPAWIATLEVVDFALFCFWIFQLRLNPADPGVKSTAVQTMTMKPLQTKY